MVNNPAAARASSGSQITLSAMHRDRFVNVNDLGALGCLSIQGALACNPHFRIHAFGIIDVK
ncbi:predicted protein [Uncinocarpus reesii 1704]|uniref:Uncharacterized protein n=1 Tax=Uncinocarpus reesii (strain UAMH 1704) TaxID=336963 RepID=C4JWH7_UNCRE|nr:uncharacterized protein UREG_06919 [Uncinocarpus reesii 1704]EEP82054.1 predicted protein [Uncinocarpus reesii 1704]